MSGKIPKLLQEARSFTKDVRLDVVLEVLSAALRDMRREVKTMEMELLRLRAFVDDPDYCDVAPKATRHDAANKVALWLMEAENRVRAVAAIVALLRALDEERTPYTRLWDLGVLRELFRPIPEGPGPVTRIYPLRVPGGELNDTQRKILAEYASDMARVECEVGPDVTVERGVAPAEQEGWDPNDDGTV